MRAKVLDSDGFAEIVDKFEIASGAVNYRWKVAGEFDGFVNNGWCHDGNERNNKADNDDVGECGGKAATFAGENIGELTDERGNCNGDK